VKILSICSLLFICMIGCSTFNAAHYDPVVYQRLTDLKPEVIELYETFSDPDINREAISSVRLKIAQLYEFEKGKPANEDAAKQIEKLRDIFLRNVRNRVTGQPWSEEIRKDHEKIISEAFDLSIKGEISKNR
jgi:hypothetical protein